MICAKARALNIDPEFFSDEEIVERVVFPLINERALKRAGFSGKQGLFDYAPPVYIPSMSALYFSLITLRLTFMVGVSSPPSTLSICGNSSNFLMV